MPTDTAFACICLQTQHLLPYVAHYKVTALIHGHSFDWPGQPIDCIGKKTKSCHRPRAHWMLQTKPLEPCLGVILHMCIHNPWQCICITWCSISYGLSHAVHTFLTEAAMQCIPFLLMQYLIPIQPYSVHTNLSHFYSYNVWVHFIPSYNTVFTASDVYSIHWIALTL
jgi:hypothetical protein